MNLSSLSTGKPSHEGARFAALVPGYRPGLFARLTEMYVLYYARTSGFGQRFESVVAGGLSEFCDRIERPCSEIWLAAQIGRVVGSLAINREKLGAGIAHLRWFVVDDGVTLWTH